MKFIIRAVDGFCAKHPRFGIPNLMLYIIMAMPWLSVFNDGQNRTFLDYLYFIPSKVAGEVWRLITFMFIPRAETSFFVSVFILLLYRRIWRTWGSSKFTIYYFAGVMLNIIYGFWFRIITGLPSITRGLDAHYINLHVLCLRHNLSETRVLLFFFIPIKIKWLALLNECIFFIPSWLHDSPKLHAADCHPQLSDFLRRGPHKNSAADEIPHVKAEHELRV